jgi:KAP family P-loop domain
VSSSNTERGRLLPDDLIPDRALTDDDPDELSHSEIAEPLADLLGLVAAPSNVALFGPYGSGKSSLLELVARALAKRYPLAHVVKYDAWKFGGAALQRNFISHIATGLGYPDNADNAGFHKGLYQKKQTVDLSLGLLTSTRRSRLTWAVIAIFIAAAVGCLIVAAVAAWLGKSALLATVGSVVLFLVGTLGGLSILGAVVRFLFEGSKVVVDESAPSSDEQFMQTFRLLIKTVIGDHPLAGARLVVMIDELDRCSSQDVISTLTAIKTFLGERHTVFVVAADRGVLEAAITGDNAAPAGALLDPYYSSAGAMLDKSFQHQLALPPPRPGRLYGYAFRLVRSRGGLWAELHEPQDGKPPVLDRVIRALVPSNVRSPRRVKVLLNNFATKARLAQARGLDWLSRAPELAKLTALETEFPKFAADLLDVPRLPSFVLQQPAALPPAFKRVVEEYVGEPTAALDPLIEVGAAESGERKAAIEAQHTHLILYLKRTVGIDDPGYDLLYLEAPGVAGDFEDPVLAHIIETVTGDDPDQASRAIAAASEFDQARSIELLADGVEREMGQDRINTVAVLLKAAADLRTVTGRWVNRGVEAVESVLTDGDLTTDQLPATLDLALRAGPEGRRLAARIEADKRLLDPATLAQLARLLPRLQVAMATRVREAIAGALLENPDLLPEVLDDQPPVEALALVKACTLSLPAVFELMMGRTPEDRLDYFEGVHRALASDPGDGAALATYLWKLLDIADPEVPAIWRIGLDDTLEMVRPVDGCAQILRVIPRIPRTEGLSLAQRLPEVPAETPLNPIFVTAALSALFASTDWASPDDAEATADTVDQIVGMCKPSWSAAQLTDLATALTPSLTRNWWTGQAETEAMKGAMTATTHLGQSAKQAADTMVEIQIAAVTRGLPPNVAASPAVLAMVRDLAPTMLQAARLRTVGSIAASVPVNPPTVTASELLRTRLALEAGTGTPPMAAEDVVLVIETDPAATDSLVSNWLSNNPEPDEVAKVAVAMTKRNLGPPRIALSSWSEGRSVDGRTSLVEGLINAGGAFRPWVEDLAQGGVDEDRLTAVLAARVLKTTRDEQRQDVVEALAALHPSSPAARASGAEIVEHLLTLKQRGALELALRALEGVGRPQRKVQRFDALLSEALDATKYKLSDRQHRILEAAGLRAPGVRSRIRRLFGG